MQGQQSIARRLTLTLILTVAAVSLVTVLLSYFYVARATRGQVEAKADEYAESLAGILDVPLWNMDEQSIVRIGQTYHPR
jgi:hypothetical protein